LIKGGIIVDKRTIGLICQASGCVLGLISILAIVSQNPLVVGGILVGAALYFIGRYIKDRL